MHKMTWVSSALTLSCFVGVVALSHGQELRFSGAGVNADGSERIVLKPEKIRLMMWIKAPGTDGKSAVKNLAEQKERVKQDLLAMKAEETSIAFGATRVVEGTGGQGTGPQQRMQMMRMRRQMMKLQGKDGGEIPELPQVFTAVSAVKAEWALPVQEGEALALLPLSLEAQVVARDLAGDKLKPQLDAAKQEQLDEAQAMMSEEMGYYQDDANGQGPIIVFVASAADEQIQSARASAFQAAAQKAEALAMAAGKKLGKLTFASTINAPDQDLRMAYYSPDYGDGSMKFPYSFTASDKNLVSSKNVDDLTLSVSVMVRFDIAD